MTGPGDDLWVITAYFNPCGYHSRRGNYETWHGDPVRRGRGQRHQGLRRMHFAPDTDLQRNADGCWEWNGDKPELETWVRDYFSSRQEDSA